MSMTLNSRERSFRTRWLDFWFAPGDPTMLGFIRIVTGLLVVYLHLSYTVDLSRFFGHFGWYGQEFVNRERKETPSVVPSIFSWDENTAMARLPEYPHRKKAVVQFIRDLPADPGQRAAGLRYLDRLLGYNNTEADHLGIQYVFLLSEVNEKRAEQLALLIEDPKSKPAKADEIVNGGNPIPPFFRTLPKEGLNSRAQVAEEIRAFWDLLWQQPAHGPNEPARPRRSEDVRYVLNHLYEMDHDHLKAIVEFLTALPTDAATRNAKLDYLEYWNADPDRVTWRGNGIFSVWFHISDPNTMMAIHIGILGVMVLFTAGVCTRLTSVLTWLAMLCYIHRSQQVLFGMDTMMSILLFYLMIGKSGAALSVDRIVQRYRAARASIRRTGVFDDRTRAFLAAPTPSMMAGFALRCIQVHFCFIYLASGLSKLKGPAWWNGNAIWDVLVNPEFTLLRYPWYETVLRTLVEVKPLYYAFIAGSAWFTLALEIGLPFLVWTRLRPYVLGGSLLLHAGIGVLMGLNLFELMMMAMILAYIPGRVVREWLKGNRASRPGFGLKFDGRSEPQVRSAALVAATDLDDLVRLENVPGVPCPTLLDADGKAIERDAALGTLTGSLRLFRSFLVLLWVPGLKALLGRKMFPTAQNELPQTKGRGPGAIRPTAAS